MSAIAAVGALVVYYYGVGAQQRCDLIIYPLITYSCDYERYATCVASYTINLIASFGVAITAIIAACLCGRAICCICIREVQTAVGNSPPPTAMQVQVQPTSGYNYPPQQQPQPTMMMMPQVQITQQTQPQPMFQQQAQDFRQQQSPQHNVVGPPSPPPSYSSTEGNAYVADTQKVPL
uniref:Potassium/sodium hyperpolarization-activated cyclic nucleotide-gated channel 1-like n=1 Tax=Saccoglossus kowalevskii TaxID=10224 RepID=A0ABM0MUJ7_SACKO